MNDWIMSGGIFALAFIAAKATKTRFIPWLWLATAVSVTIWALTS